MLNVRLVIPDDVMQKIMWWINKSNHEVSGFGSLDFDPKEGVFTVRDAILLKQEVAPTSTEIDPVAIGKAMYEMREEPNALKWHWHSHVDMGCFWSGDDRTLIANLGSQGWIVATVLNKKREMKSAFCAMVDWKAGDLERKEMLFLEDIQCGVQRYIPDDVCKEWDKQYDEHVTTAKPKYQGHNWNSGWDGEVWRKKIDEPRVDGFAKKTYRLVGHKQPVVQGGMHARGDINYNKEGYRWSFKFDRWVYNPLYDDKIRDEDGIIRGIMTMDAEECDSAWFYWEQDDFQAYYAKAKSIFDAEDIEAIEEARQASVLTLPPGGGMW